MRLDGAKKWYGAAALAAVLVLVAGWFLLVSPQRASADDITAQADNQVAANQVAQTKINALKAQYTNLPEVQKELAVLGTHIPQTANMPSLLRALSGAATASGVKLLTVTPANPAPLAAAGSGPDAGTAATPGQVNVIGVTMTISGPFANTRLFLSSLEAMPRSFLVTGLTIARPSSTTSDGSPAARGTLLSTVTGRVFTVNPGLPAATVAKTTTTTGAAVATATGTSG